jgi:hypothetical protein
MAKKKKKKKEDLRDKNLAYRGGREEGILGPPLMRPPIVPEVKPPGPINPTTGKPRPPVTKKSSNKGKGGYNSFLADTSGMGPVSPQGTVPPRKRRGRGRRMGLGFGGGGGGGGGTPGAGQGSGK